LDFWQHEEILGLAERSADIGVWNIDLATGMARGRPQFFKLMGLPPSAEPVPMDMIRALRHPDDRQRVVDGFRDAIEGGKDSYEIEYRIVRPDGQTRWIFGRGRVVRNERGEPVQYSGVDIDITSRKAAEEALAVSEQRYRLLVDHANDIVAMLNLDLVFTSINPAAERVLGYSPEEIVGQPLARFIPGEQIVTHTDMLRRKLQGATSTQYEMQLLGKDGRKFTLEVNSKLILATDGSPLAIHAVARDISDRKQAEERQGVLLKELQHRTKNMLAIVQSIASSTLRRSDGLERAHEALIGRLHALARAQELVAAGKTVGAPVRELIDAQLSPFGARVDMSGDPIIAGPTFTQSFALIVHELATNATKYGSLSVPGGSVSLKWQVEDHGDPLFTFEWVEKDGPKINQQPRREGFGTQLICIVGRPTVSFCEDGFSYLLSVPLAEVVR
jgi:PAS domain S-box-containing protein